MTYLTKIYKQYAPKDPEHEKDVINYWMNHWPEARIQNIMRHIKETDKVLDIGCGINIFKKYHNHVIGIDIVGFNDKEVGPDVVTSIEDYVNPHQFDVILCLGSIHYGDKKTILKQIEKVVSMLNRPGKIVWRINDKGLRKNSGLRLREFSALAKEHGFTLTSTEIEFIPTLRYLYVWNRV